MLIILALHLLVVLGILTLVKCSDIVNRVFVYILENSIHVKELRKQVFNFWYHSVK